MRFAYRVEAANMAEVERLVKERLRLNFAKDHLAVPRIKIVNNPSSKWLGRTTYRSREPGTSVIEIQKRIINDVDTLTRIIDHELIHHKEFLRVPLDPSQKNEHKNPHDEDFMREARRINMKMGSNWVTKKSDFSYVENSTDKEFYAILYNNKGKIGYATMVRPDTEQKDALEALLKSNQARVIKTSDGRFLKGPAFTPIPQFAIPRDPKAQSHLMSLYKKGQKTFT